MASGLSGYPGRAYRFVGCALRNDGNGDGWQMIEDDTHHPTGVPVGGVTTTTDRIEVRYSFAVAGIVSFAVTPDETLSEAGVVVGASVGVDRTKLTLIRNGGVADPRTIDTRRYPWSNLWLFGIFEPVNA